MSYTSDEIDAFSNTPQGLPSSTTPAPNRQLFMGSRDPPPTLTKSQYMALAWHQINQQSPNLSVTELEHYYAQYEMAYGEYLMNSPLGFQNPPLPPTIPQGYGTPLPTNHPYTSPTINVIVNQGAYTDKEREVEQLKADATLQEFLAWQKSARDTLSLIDNYQDAILTRPRPTILFGSSISEAQIVTLYKTIWTKLHMAIRKLCSKHTEIMDIPSPQVHQLWNMLQAIFLPTTMREKFKLETSFYALKQGKLTSRAYIQLIREKSKELRLIGIPISKERIICMLLATVHSETLKLFIYNLSPALNADECLNSILNYDQSVTNDKQDIMVDIFTPTSLNVEQKDTSYKQPFQGRCFQCNMEGHRGFECPLNTMERHINPYSGNSRHMYEPHSIDRPADNRISNDNIRGFESNYYSSNDQLNYRQFPRDNQQNQYNCSHSSERRGNSEPRRDQRDRSRDRPHGTNLGSRERSSHHNNRPSTSTRDTEAPITRTQFRALLTEFLVNHQSGNSIQPQPKKLPIEGAAYIHTPTHYRSFMMEVLDITDDSSADDVQGLYTDIPSEYV